MDRLNNVVLVAGKNGSGKSRLLQLIKEQVKKVPNKSKLEELNRSIKNYQGGITQEEVNIKNVDIQLTRVDLNELELQSINNSRKNIENNIVSYKRSIEGFEKEIESTNYFTFFPQKEDNALVDFVPQSLNLLDSYSISSQELDNYAKLIYTIGTSSISEGTIPAIEKIQKNWVNTTTVTIDDLNITKEEKEKISADYEKLRKYIKLFLNTDLKRTKEGYPEIFNKRIGEANLSNGQKILLQFCMALFAQEVSLENLIIFMDEPENHLHPAALILKYFQR